MSAATAAGAESPEFKYQLNKTLGRSGYERDPQVRLCAVLEYLDALLCVVANQDVSGEDLNDFQRMNGAIQRGVLALASDLAWEAHELHTQLHVYGDGGAK